MSNFAFARTLTTGATVAALATGILTIRSPPMLTASAIKRVAAA